ncbi:hypothetical protein [Micromonospora mangrovi]|uniref:hypothetical protein n=1 Tax=Micromonospora mangrovi TaxID=1182597 RepID=UPI00366E36D3
MRSNAVFVEPSRVLPDTRTIRVVAVTSAPSAVTQRRDPARHIFVPDLPQRGGASLDDRSFVPTY